MNALSLNDLLEPDTTECELVGADEEKGTPPVVIRGYTKASKQWQAAKARYGVKSTISVTKDQVALVDTDLSTSMKKALAELVTEITGLDKDMTADTEDGKKEIKKLFLNPQARIIVTKWNNHLDSLGNELLE